MSPLEDLNQLRFRKQALLLESGLNRQVLRLEGEIISARLARFRGGYSRLHSTWTVAAPIAGFFLARKVRRKMRLLTKGSVGVVLLYKLWRAFKR